MASYRRDLFIDTVVHRFILFFLKKRLPRFFFIPKAGAGLPKTWVSFYCVEHKMWKIRPSRLKANHEQKSESEYLKGE